MIADYKKTPRPRWAGAMLLLAVLAFIVLTNAYVAKADFIFGEVTNLGSPVNSASGDGLPRISSDGLSLYFTSDRPGGFGEHDLYVSTRATVQDQWSIPVNLGSYVNSSVTEYWPSISVDNLTLYFSSDQSGGHGGADIWQTKRATTNDEWGPVENLGSVINTSDHETAPFISSDGLELYFASDRSGIWALYVSRRITEYEEWGEPEYLVVNNAHEKNGAGASLSADGLTLFLQSERPGSFGDFDIYVTTRETKDANWSVPLNLGPQVNTQYTEFCPSISFDGHTLYFCDVPWSDFRPGGIGGGDIWQVSILPIVDFNADGNIDTDDLLILIGYWGQNEPLCDIGPMPYGDGIVDIKDLEVFMSYWEKENMPEAPEEE